MSAAEDKPGNTSGNSSHCIQSLLIQCRCIILSSFQINPNENTYLPVFHILELSA